jgi:hypothetical protein
MTENIKFTNIDDYLAHLTSERLKVTKRLREVIKMTVPEAEERVRWSTPWYYLGKKPLVYIANSAHYTTFGFAYGAKLQSDLLEGTGNNMRHIKVRSMEDFEKNKEEFVRLLKEAENVQLNI